MRLFSKHVPEPARDPRPKGINGGFRVGHGRMTKAMLDREFRENERACARGQEPKSKGWGRKLGRD